ncbi:hypothetical protein BC629DRAFT_1613236 [Irpex lacteus]|nr:hypothetical protein BC629DRAFT_1613236 [Irpex lacteus]
MTLRRDQMMTDMDLSKPPKAYMPRTSSRYDRRDVAFVPSHPIQNFRIRVFNVHRRRLSWPETWKSAMLIPIGPLRVWVQYVSSGGTWSVSEPPLTLDRITTTPHLPRVAVVATAHDILSILQDPRGIAPSRHDRKLHPTTACACAYLYISPECIINVFIQQKKTEKKRPSQRAGKAWHVQQRKPERTFTSGTARKQRGDWITLQTFASARNQRAVRAIHPSIALIAVQEARGTRIE